MTNELEKWKLMDTIGFSNYEISDKGKIKNVLTNHILSSYKNPDGYMKIRLSRYDGTYLSTYIHTLMGRVFIGEGEGLTIDHIDGIRDHNELSNLRLATKTEQRQNTKNVKRQGKKVNQIDSNNTVIKTWNTMRDAKDDGFDSQGIRKSCRKGCLYKNFYWEFTDKQNLTNEKWVSSKKAFPEYEEVDVSSHGRIRRTDGLSFAGYKRGQYMSVKMRTLKDKKYIAEQMHRVILSCFQSRRDDMVVNHIDGNSLNNCLTNLEFVTQSQNALHAQKTGLTPKNKNYRRVRVKQISLAGDFIAEFNSVREASAKTKTSETTISSVINGKGLTAGGFKWEKII